MQKVGTKVCVAGQLATIKLTIPCQLTEKFSIVKIKEMLKVKRSYNSAAMTGLRLTSVSLYCASDSVRRDSVFAVPSRGYLYS